MKIISTRTQEDQPEPFNLRAALSKLEKTTVTVDLTGAELLVLGILAGRCSGNYEESLRKYTVDIWREATQKAAEIAGVSRGLRFAPLF